LKDCTRDQPVSAGLEHVLGRKRELGRTIRVGLACSAIIATGYGVASIAVREREPVIATIARNNLDFMRQTKAL